MIYPGRIASLPSAELRRLLESVQHDPLPFVIENHPGSRDCISPNWICVAVSSHQGSALPVEASDAMHMHSYILIDNLWNEPRKMPYILTTLENVAIVSAQCLRSQGRTAPEESESMLIRTIHGTLARGEQAGAPSMNFGRMTCGSRRGSSFVARLLVMRALWTWPDAGSVPTEWTES